MSERRTTRDGGTRSLQQVASVIFVLTTVLPLLIFVWVLYSLDAMQSLHAQVGIGLSLVIAMLGFAILRTVMRRTSEVLRALVRGAPHEAPAPLHPAADNGSAVPPTPAKVTKASAAEESAPSIGSIQELRDAAAAVARQWRREAEPLLGRSVLVYAKNFREPESGTLSRLTDDGLVLEHNGIEFGVLWRLVSAIESDPRVQAAV